MAGFTSQAMVDMLGLRLEDPDEAIFSASLKLSALNWAQLRLTNLIHPAYLKELEEKQFDITCALATNDDEGSVALSELTYQPLINGIQTVKIHDGRFAHLIEPDEVRKNVNTYYQGTNKRPLAYVHNERIYVAADDDTQHIDVWYLREPQPMQTIFTIASFDTAVADITAPDLDARHCVADLGTPSPVFVANEFVGQTGYNKTKSSHFVIYANDTDDISLIYYDTDVTYEVGDELYFTSSDANVTNLASASCELNPSLHGFVVDLAESHLWRHDGKTDRSKTAYEEAVAEIGLRNARYATEGPSGVGTSGQR